MRSNKKFLASFAALLLSVGALGSAAVPAASAAPSYVRCWSFGTHRITASGGGYSKTNVPMAANNYSCWLQKDVYYESNAVMVLQYGLNGGEGYQLKTDGVFGEATRYAVWNTQKGRKVTMDSIYGPITGGAMYWHSALTGRGKWA